MAREKFMDVGRLFHARTADEKHRSCNRKPELQQSACETNAFDCFGERPRFGLRGVRLKLGFPSVNFDFSIFISKSVQFGHKSGYGHVDAESDENQNQRRDCTLAFENFRYGAIDDPVGSDKRVAHLETGASKDSAPGVICFTYGFESFNGVFEDPADWSSRLNFGWDGLVRHRFYRPPPGPLPPEPFPAFLAARLTAFLAGAFFAAFLAGAFFAAAFLAGAFFAAFLVAIVLFLRFVFCHATKNLALSFHLDNPLSNLSP
jgi:hypothetical protein